MWKTISPTLEGGDPRLESGDLPLLLEGDAHECGHQRAGVIQQAARVGVCPRVGEQPVEVRLVIHT
jgi:hypothetical protein